MNRLRPASAVRPVATAALLAAVVVLLGCETYVRRADLAEEYFNLGNAFYELEGYERAVEYYEKALALEPDLVPANFNLARAYIESGEYAQAIPILESLIEGEEESVLVLESLAYAYTKQERYEDALELYEEVLSLSPFRVSALYSSALIYRRLEEYQNARDLLGRAREAAPEDPDVLYHYGRILYDTDDPDEAVSILSDYLDEAPVNEEEIDRRLEVARIYADERYFARAISTFDQVLEVDANEPTALFEKAALQLTVIEDSTAGEENLRAALEAGFSDEERAEELLEREDLLSRTRVTELLSEAGLLAGEENDEDESDAASGQDEGEEAERSE
ncbi:MAG: tetratricopeptide repeat protein [Spirochaetota bacterium]